MLRLSRLLCIVVLILAAIGAVGAQSDTPLVVLMDGDFWTWDDTTGALNRLTSWGYNHEPSISPDGTLIAYMSYAEMTAEAIEREGGIAGGELPGNIWVMDIRTGEATRLVDQPEGASFFTEGVPDLAVIRGKPVWSPDGSMMAWSEFTYPQTEPMNQRVMVYDFATGTAETLTDAVPPQGGVPAPVQLLWGENGITVLSYAQNMQTGMQDLSYLTYDLQGNLVMELAAPVSNNRFVTETVLVEVAGRQVLGLRYNTGEWELLDPITGVLETVPAPLEMVSALAPDQSLMLSPLSTDSVQIFDAEGHFLDQFDSVRYATLSPDGQAIGYELDALGGGPTVWRNGEITLMPVGETQYAWTAVWGPTLWRVPDTSTPVVQPPPSDFACAGALTPRLVIGGFAVVLPGSPNNVRASASTSGALVGTIPAGGVFEITGGPACGDGIVWWQVNYNGVIGWTAEGTDAYFVEPAA
jgi:hypothetical protein